MTWPTAKLGDIFDIARGGSPRPIDDFISDATDAMPWISIRDASDSSKFITKTRLKIRREGIARSRVVNAGDFLLTNSMSFGRPYICGMTGCIHDGWLVLAPRDRRRVDQDFFYQLLGSDLVYRQFAKLAAGAVVKNLNIDLVAGVSVPLPPLPEQRRIADILDTADAVRRKREEGIALTEELLRSAFFEMFGDPVTNPKGWPVKALGDVTEVQGGLQVTHTRAGAPLEVPYLRVANVHRDVILLDEVKTIRVTPAELERARVSPGDILVVEGHGNPDEIGRAAVWDGQITDCVHQNHLIRVRCGNGVVPCFVSAFINSGAGRRQMRVFGKTTSGLNTISTNNVRGVRLLVPPLALQQKYSAFARGVAVATARMAEHAATSSDLFGSVVQRAFRGELGAA